jgi:hypothetical protein
MSRTYGRIAGALAAILAAGAAGYSLRPTRSPAIVATRQPSEIRTQVIRRTVHIVHRPHPGRHGASGTLLASAGAAHALGPRPTVRTGASAHAAGSSGSSAAAGTPGITTRTSGSHAASGSSSGGSGSASAPVTTRTSATHGASGSPAAGGKPVTTRTSAGAGSGPARGSAPVTSRTSRGGSGREGGDGGGD